VDGDGQPLPGAGLRGGVEDAMAATGSLNAAEGGLVLRRALDTFISAVDEQLALIASHAASGGGGGGSGEIGGAASDGMGAELEELQEQMTALSEARKAAEADAEEARAKLA